MLRWLTGCLRWLRDRTSPVHRFRRQWRVVNRHNQTVPVNAFPTGLVRVGRMTYGPLEVYSWGSPDEGLKIGSCVSIAAGAKFLLGGNHRVDCFSTFPFRVNVLNQDICEALSKGPITVEDDVWIGMGVMILSGVRIGRGAVLAAGSIITRDVPPYAIVGGNPARLIRMRFDQALIDQLLKFDYDRVDEEFILRKQSSLCKALDRETLAELLAP